VSLGRFQNCKLLEMDHFREYGVEVESSIFHHLLPDPSFRRGQAPTSTTPGAGRRTHQFAPDAATALLFRRHQDRPARGSPAPRRCSPTHPAKSAKRGREADP